MNEVLITRDVTVFGVLGKCVHKSKVPTPLIYAWYSISLCLADGLGGFILLLQHHMANKWSHQTFNQLSSFVRPGLLLSLCCLFLLRQSTQPPPSSIPLWPFTPSLRPKSTRCSSIYLLHPLHSCPKTRLTCPFITSSIVSLKWKWNYLSVRHFWRFDFSGKIRRLRGLC